MRREFLRAGFDVFCDFGKRGGAIRSGKFQAVVSGGIVAGGDVERALQFAAKDFKGNRGSGRGLSAEKDAAAFVLEHSGGSASELLGEKSRIVADEKRRIFRETANVSGDCGGGDANAVESEIVGDDAAPAGGAEMDRVGRHLVNMIWLSCGGYCILPGENRTLGKACRTGNI